MAFHDDTATRTKVREQLHIYMHGSSKSAEQVAKYIDEHRIDIAPEVTDRHAAIDHGSISRLLAGRVKAHRSTVEILYRFLVYVNIVIDPDIRFRNRPGVDPAYQLMENFFGVPQRNLNLCRSLVGTYNIFFRSEDLPLHVVVGAITFSENLGRDSFDVKECQEMKKLKSVENWSGYYFSRQSHLILVLKGESISLDNQPKFYILRPPHTNQNQMVTGTTGMMFKIGSAGGAFFSKILLRRDDEALFNCDVLPEVEIPHDILSGI